MYRILTLFQLLCFGARADWYVDQAGAQKMYSIEGAAVVLPNVTVLEDGPLSVNILAELRSLQSVTTALQQSLANATSTIATLESRVTVLETSADTLSNRTAALETSTADLSTRMDAVPGGCSWDGIGCQCYLDNETVNDAALLLGSNCVNGTLQWVRILDAKHYDDIIVSCEAFVNATILSTCDVMF